MPLVNSETFDLLTVYTEYRLQLLQKELESVTPDRLLSVQGAISELRKILVLREHTQKDAQ